MSAENSELSKTWSERIMQQRSSGLTQKEWCSQNNLSIHTLQWWIRKLGMRQSNSKPQTKFVKASVPPESRTSAHTIAYGSEKESTLRLQYISLLIPDGYDTATVKELLGEIIG